MKLYIKRDQESGMLGGVTFLINARVQLDSGEMDMIKKFKAHKWTVVTTKHPLFGDLNYKIEDLINGVGLKSKDLGSLIESENLLKQACRTLNHNVKVMASFGGEELVNFDEPESN